MAETLKLMLRQPGYFMWPLINAMMIAALGAMGIWLLWLEPMSVVISEYAPPQVNGIIADQQYVPVKKSGGMWVTRHYHRHKMCPTTAIISVWCNSGETWTFPPRGATATHVGELPPRTFNELQYVRDVPVNIGCQLLVQAESICTLGPHIDHMTPAKFKIVE